MVANILRWSGNGLLVLLLSLTLVIASFRLAASIRETDVLGDSLRNIAESTGEPASGPVLPRVSLGPTDDIAR